MTWTNISAVPLKTTNMYENKIVDNKLQHFNERIYENYMNGLSGPDVKYLIWTKKKWQKYFIIFSSEQQVPFTTKKNIKSF